MKTNLRLPDDLHNELVKAADAAERSLNAEIVYRLKLFESLPSPLKNYIIHQNYELVREWLATSSLSTRVTRPSST